MLINANERCQLAVREKEVVPFNEPMPSNFFRKSPLLPAYTIFCLILAVSGDLLIKKKEDD
jgi:hypothetical protein